MKRFTQKFFLLTIGMILSVGAYAQDEGTPVTQHGYPEIKFTYNKIVHTIPAWDAWWMTDGEHHYVTGHIRVQKKTKRDDGKFVGKIVTRYFLYDDATERNRLRVPSANASSFKVTNVTINGEVVADEADLMTLTYGIVPSELRLENYNYETVFVYDKTGIGVSQGSTDANGIDSEDEYIVPTTLTHSTTGDVYEINEVGDYAYRQHWPSRNNSNFFQPHSITIPKGITKIGRGAFFMAPTEKVVFEDGNTIETILEFNFQDNPVLEEITFPSSVNKLMGTVLGGCAALRKITFARDTPPTLKKFTWSNVERDVFESTTTADATKPNQCIIEVPLHAAKTYVDSNDKFKEFPMSSKFTMNKDYISYCSDLPFTFKQYDTASKTWNEGNVKAYYVTDSDVKLSEGKIDITEIAATKIPSEIVQGITPLDSYNDETGFETGYFGVILSGTAGETYDIFYPNNLPCDEISINPHENLLQGVINQAYIGVTNDYLFFVLTNGKFLTVEKPGNLAAHKVFLFYSGDQTMPLGARELSISLPEETGIINHEVNRVQNDVFYNLQGIQVQQPSKGIFIKNGKKFVIK